METKKKRHRWQWVSTLCNSWAHFSHLDGHFSSNSVGPVWVEIFLRIINIVCLYSSSKPDSSSHRTKLSFGSHGSLQHAPKLKEAMYLLVCLSITIIYWCLVSERCEPTVSDVGELQGSAAFVNMLQVLLFALEAGIFWKDCENLIIVPKAHLHRNANNFSRSKNITLQVLHKSGFPEKETVGLQ